MNLDLRWAESRWGNRLAGQWERRSRALWAIAPTQSLRTRRCGPSFQLQTLTWSTNERLGLPRRENPVDRNANTRGYLNLVATPTLISVTLQEAEPRRHTIGRLKVSPVHNINRDSARHFPIESFPQNQLKHFGRCTSSELGEPLSQPQPRTARNAIA